MHKIKIKPLSLNHAYRGRRFATSELKAYKEAVAYLAPKIKVPEGKLKIKLEFGMSSKNTDTDNHCKALIDALAEKYLFNDNRIYKIEAEKRDVKKGEEYVAFEFENYA